MNQFSPYSQPMMNNPYQNGYNPMLSPQQRLQQMEMQYPQFTQQNQFMQQPVQQQSQVIVGKIVNDVSNVSPNDVPMDGSVAVFPKNDMTEIYCKQWTANGTIQTVVYKPILEQNNADATNTPQMDFNALNEDVRALREDIKGVREMIEKSMNVPTPKPNQRGKKTEVNSDE